jgi:hypothetical protein
MEGNISTNIDLDTSRELWPGRYTVKAEITYRDRKGKVSTMHVIHFQPEMDDEEVKALLVPLGYAPGAKEYRYLASQARDTFSQEQAEALVAYLNRRKGTTASMKPAQIPLPALMGASAVPLLPSFRDRSVYKLHLEAGYDLNFKVEAINIKTFISMAHLFREFREQDREV